MARLYNTIICTYQCLSLAIDNSPQSHIKQNPQTRVYLEAVGLIVYFGAKAAPTECRLTLNVTH